MQIINQIVRFLYLVVAWTFLAMFMVLILASVPVAIAIGAVMFAVDAGGAWAFQDRSVKETWREWNR